MTSWVLTLCLCCVITLNPDKCLHQSVHRAVLPQRITNESLGLKAWWGSPTKGSRLSFLVLDHHSTCSLLFSAALISERSRCDDCNKYSGCWIPKHQNVNYLTISSLGLIKSCFLSCRKDKVSERIITVSSKHVFQTEARLKSLRFSFLLWFQFMKEDLPQNTCQFNLGSISWGSLMCKVLRKWKSRHSSDKLHVLSSPQKMSPDTVQLSCWSQNHLARLHV